MNWKRELLRNFKLYAITDLKAFDLSVIRKVDAAFQGGVDVVQLRSKLLSDAELYRLAVEIRKLASKRKKLFIINDRVDLMLASGADGVHLGQGDLPLQAARKIIGQGKLIGVSTHSIKQALTAQKGGADYIGFGPVFSTPTKPDYKPVGLNAIKLLERKVKIPYVCIGGINASNIKEVLNAGARRVAVVRAIFDAPNPKLAAAKLKQRMM